MWTLRLHCPIDEGGAVDPQARIVRLHDILSGRSTPIQAVALQEALGCSRTTLQRMLTRLRDELHAPVMHVAEQGYCYDVAAGSYELPGMWLDADELASLMVVDALLARLESGVLQSQTRLLRAQIEVLLAQAVVDESVDAARLRERMQIVTPRFLAQRPEIFATVCEATLHGQRLTFADYARKRGEPQTRHVSPQRLLYFHENWFLQAWCHDVGTSHVFALARLHHIKPAAGKVHAVDSHAFEHGRLAGATPIRHVARLRFMPSAAASVAGEFWHPEQHGQFATDGTYELSVPYRQVQDILGQILGHGAAVFVESPKSLRKSVVKALDRASARYTER